MMGPATAVALAALAAFTALAAATLAKARRHVVVTVEGTSMAPTYHPGDRLLVRRCALLDVRRGQAVVVLRPDLVTGWQDPNRSAGLPGDSPWFIKRATALAGDPLPASPPESPASAESTVPPNHLYLLGDNPASEDSRRWGCCPGERVVGVVVRQLK